MNVWRRKAGVQPEYMFKNVVPSLPWKCRLLQSLGPNTETISIIYVYALFETLSFFKTFDINGRKAKNDGV